VNNQAKTPREVPVIIEIIMLVEPMLIPDVYTGAQMLSTGRDLTAMRVRILSKYVEQAN